MKNASYRKKDIHYEEPAQNSPLNLSDVKIRFEHWRCTRRKKRSPIPAELWDAAVSLSADYSVHQVSKALRLSYSALKERVQLSGADRCESDIHEIPINGASRITQTFSPTDVSNDFIELDLKGISPASECVVELEKADGAKLKASFRDNAGVLLLKLAEAFFRSK